MSHSFTEGSDKAGDTVKLLNHLQGKVKQLHAENISLKRGGSTPNLAEVGIGSSTDAVSLQSYRNILKYIRYIPNISECIRNISKYTKIYQNFILEIYQNISEIYQNISLYIRNILIYIRIYQNMS